MWGCGQAVNIWEEEEASVIRLCKHWPLIHTQIPEESLESGKAQMGNGFYSSPDPPRPGDLIAVPMSKYPFTQTSLTLDFLHSLQKGVSIGMAPVKSSSVLGTELLVGLP